MVGKWKHHAVDYEVEGMRLHLLQSDETSIGFCTRKAALDQHLDVLLQCALIRHFDLHQDGKSSTIGHLFRTSNDILYRVLLDKLSAYRAIGLTHTCIKQTQIVINLS